MRNYEIVDKILKYHPLIPDYRGCDEYKYGNPEAECLGIAVALVPTVEVLHRMIEKGCNLLITHEPIFYQTPDYPAWRGSFPNTVYEEKVRLLKAHGLTVWRDHDHMHAHQPDSIFTGVIKYLGWTDYYQTVGNKREPEHCYRFELPEMTVAELGKHLVNKLQLNGLRYMGNPDMKVRRVALVGHLYPNSFSQDGLDSEGFYWDYGMKIMEIMEEEQGVEAIIPGEIIEWTVLSYIRDAITMKKTKACFNIGHFSWEELGMRYAKDWISELIENRLPVHYIPTGDAFLYL